MSHGLGKGSAICPYFVREASKQVTCEGFIEGAYIAVVFQSNEDLQWWQKEKCLSWNYLDCPIAQKLYQMCEKGDLDDN